MKTLILLIFSCLLTSSVFAQNFNERNIDQNRLESLVLKKLNQHRKELNLSLLQSEIHLQKAAAYHSKYQVDNNILTHDQKNKKYASPYKRVLVFGGTNGLIGENVAYVSLKKTYEELAEGFYQGWKNSPPHYENMIHPDYRYSGMRFHTNSDRSLIYGTHVFGGEMYIPPPVANFPIGAYGVKDYDEKTCRVRRYYGRSAQGLAHSIFTEGDSIFLYYEDDELLKKTIIKENDALAVDIIERRQLACGKLNSFHGSDVHDGMMLPPMYKKRLFEKYKRRHYRGFKIFMGLVPKGIQGHKDFSMITIQDSCKCDYGYSIEVPGGDLELFHINPIWAFAELKEKNYVDTLLPLGKEEGWTKVKKTTSIIEAKKTFEVGFEKNKSQLNQLPPTLLKFLKKNKKTIKSIKIEAFSSVEGPTDRNLFLQKKRAEKIQSELQKNGIQLSKISKQSKENWELFFAQINDTEWQIWKDKPKGEIKKLLNNQPAKKDIEPLLVEERVAKVLVVFDEEIESETYSTAYFDDATTSDDFQFLIKYFKQLVAMNKTDSALLVQYDLIQHFLEKKISIQDITDVEIPLEKENLPLLSNQLAVELFFRKRMRTDKPFVKKVKQMAQLGENYLPMKFNFYGFATRYLYLALDTIVDPIDLEFDIQYLLEDDNYQATYLDAKKTVDRLLVNFHLGVVEYYEEKRAYELIGESLEFIKDYFIDEGLTELETIRLALYFNRHGRTNWTLELLFPYLEKGNYLENTLFIYVQTIAHKIGLEKLNKIRFIKYGKIAAERNSDRFCKWFNKEFQMLRYNEVKQLYCKTCE
ncbi:MAG: CAP domain-containing protein [Saprospiraceae bacterium]